MSGKIHSRDSCLTCRERPWLPLQKEASLPAEWYWTCTVQSRLQSVSGQLEQQWMKQTSLGLLVLETPSMPPEAACERQSEVAENWKWATSVSYISARRIHAKTYFEGSSRYLGWTFSMGITNKGWLSLKIFVWTRNGKFVPSEQLHLDRSSK